MSTSPSPDAVARDLQLGDGQHHSPWRWLIAVLVLLAFAGGAWFWLWGDGSGGGPVYVTAEVRRGDLHITVTATGTLQPTNQVDVSSELSGIIRKVLVDHNDVVDVGQSLAELDTDKLEAEVARARATLAAAKAKVREAEAVVDEAQRNFERYGELAERNVASQQKYDEARAAQARAVAALASARADTAVSEANLKLRETDLRKACICSPIRGVILRRSVEPGQTIAATLQAPVLFTIAEDLAAMELQVDVDEADVSLVEAGQSARFTVDAYPNRDFPATITKVRYAPETVEGVVTYKAHLAVDNSALLLRPGMTATAEIAVRDVADALLVPNEALRFVPMVAADAASRGLVGSILPRPPVQNAAPRADDAGNGGVRRIWLLRDGAPAALSVTVGLSDGSMTEITAGDLTAGQVVIVDRRDAGS